MEYPLVQRNIPTGPCQIRKKAGWLLGRNCLPGLHIGVVDTFFSVLVISHDIVRQDKKSPSIGILGMSDGVFIAQEE